MITQAQYDAFAQLAKSGVLVVWNLNRGTARITPTAVELLVPRMGPPR